MRFIHKDFTIIFQACTVKMQKEEIFYLSYLIIYCIRVKYVNGFYFD